MKAMSVIPGRHGSALIAESPDPPPAEGSVLAEGLLAGICGTDAEILLGQGLPPGGGPRLVIGHESLGRVLEAPPDAPVRPGDLVVGVVRRPDPVPCPACAAGQWDFCANGQYAERGIKGLDGYGATRWRVGPRFAVKVPDRLGDLGVLTEPASVVAKAWEQIDLIAARALRSARVALVAGAGPIGMLAALLGVQRGYQMHVFDRVAAGPKPGLVAALGATYHHGPVTDLGLRPDIALECTGDGELVLELAGQARPGGRDVPDRHLVPPAQPAGEHEPGQRLDGAGKLGDLRHGERGAPPLRAGRRGPVRGRSGLARRPDQPPRPAVIVAAGAHQAAK